MILFGADSRPPMLDKDLYNSWKSRMELYMQNRDNGRRILELVKYGPLIWPTVEENGMFRTKAYDELSAAEKIQVDCDMKATNIILQHPPPDIYSLMNHHKVVIPQVAYQSPPPTAQHMIESPFVDSGFAVPMFSLGDDLIAYHNKAMGNTASGQARVVKCYNCQGDGHMARQCTQPKRPRNAVRYKEKAMLAEAQEAGQILDEEQLTKDLDTYDFDCDDLSTAQAVLMANISNYGSEVILEKKIVDQKCLKNKKDPEAVKQNISHKPINYEKLNLLTGDFGKHFTPQQELSAKQAFWLHISNPTIEYSSTPPIKMDVPSELPKSQINHQTSSVPQVIPQVAYQSPPPTAQHMIESPFVDSGFVVPVFSLGDDLIAYHNKAMVFLIVVASLRFPSTNNQLRISSNLRNQATIQDGRVTVQQVQGRQWQNYSGTTYKSNATGSKGNTASGQARVVKCYNCQGDGHMARQCTQPKRPRNVARYKEKAMLAEAQEVGQILDEEQLVFLTEPRILASQAQTIIPHNAAFQTKDLDTYDFDFDDLSTAQAVLMANISNYGSKVISEKKIVDQKCLKKKKDPEAIKQNISHKPINYEKLNLLTGDFGKHFTPQQELSAKQAFWLHISNPTIEYSSTPPIKMDVPSELPKRSESCEKCLNLDAEFSKSKQAAIKLNETKVAITPMNKIKEVTFAKPVASSSTNQETHESNKPVLHSTRVKCSTSASRSKPSGNIKHNRISQQSSSKKINKVEDQPRRVKTRKNKKNYVNKLKCNDHVMQSMSNANSVFASISNAPVKDSMNDVKSCCLCAICDSECSKHMTGNRFQLMNFVSKFLGTVRFENDQIARIMGYGDFQLGNISRVYYVEGLRHNLFSVGQFCDADLEFAFQKNTCFIRNLEGVDLLSGSQDTNLYTISLDDMLKSSPICLLSKASKTKSWLWHRRLSHLNFGTLNKISKDSLARGIPRLKFQKDHLCSACALEKSKKSSHQPKAKYTNQEKLYLLHMDLTKDEAPAAIIKCLKNIQVRLKATVRHVRTNNETEFVNQTLHEFYDNVIISHQTSVARTPQQNGVVERRNWTLVEAAHDWIRLFQPMFDEYFNPLAIVVSTVQEVVALRDEVLADSSVSTSINHDAPSTSILSSQEQEHFPIIYQGFKESPKTSTFHDDLLNESPHEDLTPQGSSSNVRQIYISFEHPVRWTKDHPISNVISDPSRYVFTRKKLETT
nr:hypothetical protein [Tanacetum cinerariifolium]